MIWTGILATAFVSYLVGSFPSGYVAGWLRGVDLRKEGSGNIGATNALRVLGKKIGYAVFAADTFKGWLAVIVGYLFAHFFAPDHSIKFGVLGAVAGVLGHLFPVWLKFRGGKGIATSGGVMLGLFPWPVFAFGLIIWLALFFTTRYVSIASLGAALALPTGSTIMTLLGRCDWLRVGIAGILCVLAIWRHKSNIQRLLTGTEKKFEKKSDSDHSKNPHV